MSSISPPPRPSTSPPSRSAGRPPAWRSTTFARPSRRYAQRTRHHRQRGQTLRYGVGERQRQQRAASGGRHHARRQTRAGRQVPRPQVGLRTIDGQKVTYTKYDMATAFTPTMSPSPPMAGSRSAARMAAPARRTARSTRRQSSTWRSIPRASSTKWWSNGPEGLAMSPTGAYAVAVILNGREPAITTRTPMSRSSRSRARTWARSARPKLARWPKASSSAPAATALLRALPPVSVSAFEPAYCSSVSRLPSLAISRRMSACSCGSLMP